MLSSKQLTDYLAAVKEHSHWHVFVGGRELRSPCAYCREPRMFHPFWMDDLMTSREQRAQKKKRQQ